MKFGGKIKELNQIIISDPSYENGTYGRYEKTNINEKNMNISMEIHDFSEKIRGIQINGIEFYILISKSDDCKLLKDGSFSHNKSDQIISTDIGVDTSCVALGINEFANDIRNAKEEWHPPFALETLSDGIFGEVREGKRNGKLDFIFITGFLDGDTEYSIDDVLNYISTYFEVTDLYKEVSGVKFPIVDNDKDITDDII